MNVSVDVASLILLTTTYTLASYPLITFTCAIVLKTYTYETIFEAGLWLKFTNQRRHKQRPDLEEQDIPCKCGLHLPYLPFEETQILGPSRTRAQDRLRLLHSAQAYQLIPCLVLFLNGNTRKLAWEGAKLGLQYHIRIFLHHLRELPDRCRLHPSASSSSVASARLLDHSHHRHLLPPDAFPSCCSEAS